MLFYIWQCLASIRYSLLATSLAKTRKVSLQLEQWHCYMTAWSVFASLIVQKPIQKLFQTDRATWSMKTTHSLCCANPMTMSANTDAWHTNCLIMSDDVQPPNGTHTLLQAAGCQTGQHRRLAYLHHGGTSCSVACRMPPNACHFASMLHKLTLLNSMILSSTTSSPPALC